MKYCKVAIILLGWSFNNLLYAQTYFQKANYLFENQQYSTSASAFEWSLQNESLNRFQQQEAEIKIALCAYQQLRQDAENKLYRALYNYPASPWITELQFAYAHLLFLKQDFDKLATIVDSLKPEELPHSLQSEALFIKGYWAFRKKNYAEASKFLSQIEPDYTRYQEALYYRALSLYHLQAYEQALPLLEQLEQTETYKLKVPVYLLNCLVALDHPKLLGKGEEYVQANPAPEGQATIAITLAKFYFAKADYPRALSFAEKACSLQPTERSLAYLAGFSAYQLAQYSKALSYFEKTLEPQDTIAQHSAYYAAFSAIHLQQYDRARSLFQKAIEGPNPAIKPEALFQYGKISCQLKEYPDALQTLKLYLAQYPQHPNTEEAKGLIGEALLYSGNLPEAISYFEKSLSQDKRIQQSFQKTCFYFAIQLAEKQALDSALLYLKKAINLNSEPTLTLNAKFWLAELYYQQAQYEAAEKAYQDFIDSPGASQNPYYAQALAGYGWSIFQRKDYPKAIQAFQQSLQRLHTTQHPNLHSNILLRLGDCHFVLKNYEKASEYYTQVIDKQLPSSDYAYLQNGLCFARKGKYREAIQNLETLVHHYPNSSYRPRALDEASEILITWLSNYSKGSEYAQMLIKDYPQHPLLANAYLHLGIAAYNAQDPTTAKKHFQTVILEYGNYEKQVATAWDALNSLLEPNEIDTLRKTYLNRYPHAIQALENLTFQQAREKFYAEEYEEAIRKFSYYLETYPTGKNRSEALLMRGDSYEKRNQYDLALKDYEEVLQSPFNPFTSLALKHCAALYQTQKQYSKAEAIWLQLDSIATNYQEKIYAKMGLADLYLLQNQYSKAQAIYQSLLEDPETAEYTATRAKVQIAKTYIGQKEFSRAEAVLRQVASQVTNALGAEAQYLLTLSALEQKNFEQCRAQALVFREKFTGYNEWKAKAYYLLAQAYWMNKEHFQAIETLKSLLKVQDPNLASQVRSLLEKYQQEYAEIQKQTRPSAPSPAADTLPPKTASRAIEVKERPRSQSQKTSMKKKLPAK